MNKSPSSLRSMLGVTLLEIMLVLAIAAIVIILSIRYYQQAVTNQRITAAISGIAAVKSAVNQLILSGKKSASTDAKSLLGRGFPTSPWTSADFVVTDVDSGGTYTITIATFNQSDCNQVVATAKLDPDVDGAKSSCSNNNATITINTIPAATPS